MGKENSIDKAFNQIKEILDIVKRKKNETISFDKLQAIDQMLTDLEKQVDEYVENSEDQLRDVGVSNADIRRVKEEIPEELTEDDKETLKRALKLKEEVLDVQKEIHQERGEQVIEEEVAKDLPKKKKKQKKLTKKGHKKKFRRLGGSKKWKPL